MAQREFARLVVPTAVLVEVYRGTGSDAAVDRVAGRLANTVALDVPTARLAGRLRTRAGRGSAVDAVVVATAVRLGGGIVATADVEDITALAAEHANVRVWSLANPP